MSLPVDTESYDYRFNKTLNEDVKLTSNEYGEWDIKIEDGDYVNVTGLESLANACIIMIMTRYNELHNNPLYTGFGCRVHELIKDNQTSMVLYKMELFITEALESMRRVQTVNSVNVKRNDAYGFNIYFDITSINDETIRGGVTL